MKTTNLVKGVALGVTIIFILAVSAADAFAAKPKLYKMEGKISAIDLNHNTVVVNVHLTKKNIFTVGGPLAKDAVLKKGNKKAFLKDFSLGESVIVEWEPTTQGHLIKRLESK